MSPKPSLRHEVVTASVIGAFYHVYNQLGYGFLESVYSAAMEMELRRRGHTVAREVRVRVYFEGVPMSAALSGSWRSGDAAGGGGAAWPAGQCGRAAWKVQT